jgi:hypothetical protein
MGAIRKSGVALTALALALTVLASCGGSGEAGEASISERQFLKRGDKICREVFAKITRRYSKLSGYVAARADSDVARERQMNAGTQRFVLPAIEELVLRLRALGAPAGQADRLEKALAALEAGIERGEKDPRAVRGSLGVEFAFQDGYEMLPALGLEGCE